MPNPLALCQTECASYDDSWKLDVVPKTERSSMRLLVVTDHRFIRMNGQTFDEYCFDYDFFSDYLDVFPEVTLAARVRDVQAAPPGVQRTDGKGLTVLPLPDLHSFRWLLSSRRLRRVLTEGVRHSDAVCVRVPSLAGRLAAHIANREQTPLMFELIGDPLLSIRAAAPGTIGKVLATWEDTEVRKIVKRSVSGTYVSHRHLQARYPPSSGVVTASVSSIRLNREWLTQPRKFPAPPSPLNLVLVASLVPVKHHEILLRSLHEMVILGLDVRLNLVGDGPLRGKLQSLAARLEIGERVRFFGHIAERKELAAVLDASDLFVMASATEGLPRSMIEAMARGLPAVGCDIPGIAELLDKEQLISVNEPGAWAAKIQEICAEPERLNRYAERSYNTSLMFEDRLLSKRRQYILGKLKETSGER